MARTGVQRAQREGVRALAAPVPVPVPGTRSDAADLADRVRAWLVRAGREPTAESVAAALGDLGVVAERRTMADLVRRLQQELAGAGPLQPFLEQSDVGLQRCALRDKLRGELPDLGDLTTQLRVVGGTRRNHRDRFVVRRTPTARGDGENRHRADRHAPPHLQTHLRPLDFDQPDVPLTERLRTGTSRRHAFRPAGATDA